MGKQVGGSEAIAMRAQSDEQIVIQPGLGLRALFLFTSLGMAVGSVFLFYDAIETGKRVYGKCFFSSVGFAFSCVFAASFYMSLKKWIVDIRGVRCGWRDRVVGIQWKDVRSVYSGLMGHGIVVKSADQEIYLPDFGGAYPKVVRSIFDRADSGVLEFPRRAFFMSQNLCFLFIFCACALFCIFMDMVVMEGESPYFLIALAALFFGPLLFDVSREPSFIFMSECDLRLHKLTGIRRIPYSEVRSAEVELVKENKGGWDCVLVLGLETEVLRLRRIPNAVITLYFMLNAAKRRREAQE